MKRKLTVLCILFLILCMICLFYPIHSPGMLGALMVELVFFIHYLLLKPKIGIKMTEQDNAVNKESKEMSPQIQQKQTTVKDLQTTKDIIAVKQD